MDMTQQKLNLSTSLSLDPKEIKRIMVDDVVKRNGVTRDQVAKVHTGLSYKDYLNRPFNKKMYRQWLHQQTNYKWGAKFNFWIL